MKIPRVGSLIHTDDKIKAITLAQLHPHMITENR